MFTQYSTEDIELIKLAHMRKQESNTTKTKDPILDKLASHVRLFKGLDVRDVAKLVDDVKVSKYKKGQVIYENGSLDARYYFVMRGSIAILTKDKKTIVRQLRSTQTFGEKYALFGQPRPYVAIATSDDITSVLSFKVPSEIPESFGHVFARFYKNVAAELSIRDKKND
jgi:CRP-like cAMP-binding protein